MSGVDVFAQVCGHKVDTSSNYCDNIQPYDKRRFNFCQMWHIFLHFLGKLPQIRTSKFRKVVRQHIQQWNNFENPLRTDKVVAMSLVYYFFGTQCWMRTDKYIHTQKTRLNALLHARLSSATSSRYARCSHWRLLVSRNTSAILTDERKWLMSSVSAAVARKIMSSCASLARDYWWVLCRSYHVFSKFKKRVFTFFKWRQKT